MRSGARLPLLALAACGAPRLAHVQHPERLDGRWKVEFRLDEPLQLRADPAAAGTVRGELSLIDAAAGARAAGLDGPATHFGVYAADFRRFGFGGRGAVPTLAVRLAEGDSVQMVLDPGHEGPVLTGVVMRDSVAGRWRYQSGRAAEAAGRFVMRRER